MDEDEWIDLVLDELHADETIFSHHAARYLPERAGHAAQEVSLLKRWPTRSSWRPLPDRSDLYRRKLFSTFFVFLIFNSKQMPFRALFHPSKT